MYFFLWAQQPYSVLDRLIVEDSRSHSVTPHSVALLWTRDRPAAETSLTDSTQHSQVSPSLISKNETIEMYRVVILPVLCGCETWSLTLGEQHWLMLLESRMLGSNADKITGDWKRLHNEEPYGLYSSPKIMRVINENEMGGACGAVGWQERCMQGFGGETRGKMTTRKTSA